MPRRLEIWLPTLVVAADQASKALVRAMVPLYSTVTVIPGVLNITHIRNSGAAFGLLNATDFPLKAALLGIIAMGALIAVGLYAAQLAHHQIVARVGLALILGGAAGNLVDRVVVGSVVDFVDAYWRAYHFWAFNVADSAITVGVGIMLIDMFGAKPHAS
jgi:signal peptidase II